MTIPDDVRDVIMEALSVLLGRQDFEGEPSERTVNAMNWLDAQAAAPEPERRKLMDIEMLKTIAQEAQDRVRHAYELYDLGEPPSVTPRIVDAVLKAENRRGTP